MRLSLLSQAAHRRTLRTTTKSTSLVCSSCWCFYTVILSCLILVVSASTTAPAPSTPTPTPTLQSNPRNLHQEVNNQPSLPSRSNQQHAHHQNHPRHPRPTPAPIPNPNPAQFWAGWPKETITSVRTVTLTEPGIIAGGGVSPVNPEDVTTTQIAEATTTIYDSNIPASGTLTVISVVTVSPGGNGVAGGGGGGIVETVSTTTFLRESEANQSGTLTRTRTATIQTRLPQETSIWTPVDIPRFAECLPGDENYQEDGTLSLTKEQKPTLIALAIMFFVILIGWNFVIVRDILYPLKMLVVLIHETGHVIGGVAAGRKLETLYLDPSYGGHIIWETEVDTPFPLRWPPAALPLGYLMSAFVGASLILCGFNTLASKVASFIIGILMLVVAFNLLKAPLGMALVVATVGLLVAFWFIDHAMYLRYYILFIGVMCCWYIIWDFVDDFVFAKMYPCCAVLHSQVLGSLQPFIWLYIYLAITAIIFVGWLLIAIYVFRQSPHSMFCQGQSFLPT